MAPSSLMPKAGLYDIAGATAAPPWPAGCTRALAPAAPVATATAAATATPVRSQNRLIGAHLESPKAAAGLYHAEQVVRLTAAPPFTSPPSPAIVDDLGC
jgi:hypothetical protein